MVRVRALLLALAAIVAAAPAGPAAAHPDPAALCGLQIDWIERSGLVPRGLLHAIALVESGRWLSDRRQSRPWPWTVMAGERAYYLPTREAALGTIHRLQAAGRTNIGVGCMQINLRHHGDTFAAFDDPAGALLDPATNVAYAAAFLQRLRAEARSWWQAAGYYHSRDPEAAAAYRAKVGRFWREDRGRPPPAAADGRRRVLADGSAETAAGYAPAAGQRGHAAATVRELVRRAEAGDPDTQEELAALYARGEGVPRDDVQALKWYMLAALHGKPARSLPLQETRRGMTPEQIREAEVQALFWTPARRPDPPGLGGDGGHPAGSLSAEHSDEGLRIDASELLRLFPDANLERSRESSPDSALNPDFPFGSHRRARAPQESWRKHGCPFSPVASPGSQPSVCGYPPDPVSRIRARSQPMADPSGESGLNAQERSGDGELRALRAHIEELQADKQHLRTELDRAVSHASEERAQLLSMLAHKDRLLEEQAQTMRLLTDQRQPKRRWWARWW